MILADKRKRLLNYLAHRNTKKAGEKLQKGVRGKVKAVRSTPGPTLEPESLKMSARPPKVHSTSLCSRLRHFQLGPLVTCLWGGCWESKCLVFDVVGGEFCPLSRFVVGCFQAWEGGSGEDWLKTDTCPPQGGIGPQTSKLLHSPFKEEAEEM